MKKIATIILLMLPFAVAAGGDDIIQSNDMNNQTTGDVNIQGGDLVSGNGDAFGIGIPGLGDVDIAGCLGSEQWTLLIGGKQKLVLNWPCMAEFYLRNNEPDLAAMALCNTEILDEFDDEEACEAAHDFLAEMPDQPPNAALTEIMRRLVALEDRVTSETTQLVAEHDEVEEQVQLVGALQREVRYLQQQVAEVEQMPAQEPEIVYIDEGAERRARARAARDEILNKGAESGTDEE